jgi:cytoskeletal protein RodZ
MVYFEKESSHSEQEVTKEKSFSCSQKLMKIFGWLLLLIGLIIIGWTLVFSYNIINLKTEVPEVFKIETEQSDQPSKPLTLTQAQLQQELEKMIADQLTDFLPPDFLARTFNLIAWSIIAFILIFGGAQTSSLGIKMIKK